MEVKDSGGQLLLMIEQMGAQTQRRKSEQTHAIISILSLMFQILQRITEVLGKLPGDITQMFHITILNIH